MGWFKIDRKIADHWLWQSRPFSDGNAWIDLILLANHEDGKYMYRGQLKEIKRGTVCRSMLYLAERWGWSRGKVKRFLDALEREGMVTVNATTHDTTIFLVNYENYQDRRATKRTTDGHQTGSKRTTDGHIQEEYKNYKEGKESGGAADCPSGTHREIDPDDYVANFYASRDR